MPTISPGISPIKALRQWKALECPECEFRGGCPQSKDNLIECLTEDVGGNEYWDMVMISRRAVRVFTRMCMDKVPKALRIFGGLALPLPPATPPPDRSAELMCSNMEEFSQWSTNQS